MLYMLKHDVRSWVQREADGGQRIAEWMCVSAGILILTKRTLVIIITK